MAALSQPHFAPNIDPEDMVVFDEAHFLRQTFGDRGLQLEIIALFIAQIEDSRKALAAPMTTTAWRFMTHTLKGASRPPWEPCASRHLPDSGKLWARLKTLARVTPSSNPSRRKALPSPLRQPLIVGEFCLRAG